MNIPAHSSFIQSIRYDEAEQRLRVEIGNHFYYYYEITKQKVARLKSAKSKGSYFTNYIKGKYQSSKRRKV